ncbi:Integral membrane protein (PIN domain superfamily) [Legionella beliardensis]|uniref:Integral membrane protein (PIN domain superfamily) n=1 Tax=Legionella beliardensis TaxID=91822 RepID=A0A378I148_9GAMM|nr:hypothetical protein [Legionella beliardensis]STX28326.1 Integral membrane protein (PIN domain superfamily) [Legionella beliardensis]
MPNFNFFANFNKKEPLNKLIPDAIVQELLQKIAATPAAENTYQFIDLLKKKRNAFLREIESTSDLNKRNKLIHAYLNFAATVWSCVLDKDNALKNLGKYYLSLDYHLTYQARLSQDELDPTAHQLALGGTISGLGLLALSGIALGISMPIIGIIGLSLALTVLVPSLFYLAVETLPNQIKAIQEEVSLFKGALNIELPKAEITAIKQDERANNDDDSQVIGLNTLYA